MPRSSQVPQVHKFGGASLADGAGIARCVSIIQAQRPARMVVVVSALGGVTDALLDIAARAVAGEGDAVRAGVEALRARHASVAEAALSGGPRRRTALDAIDQSFAELEQIAIGLSLVRELTPRTTDYLVSRGERLSAHLVSAALEQGGISVALIDALEVVKADSTFGHATPNLALSDRAARKRLGPLLSRGVVPVVPGFIASTPDGQLATLGRGGSDLTATLLGRALGAREVCLWKDVPGMLTADPRVVPDARVIPQLHQREAAELAYYGAKVLHPRALIPVAGRALAIRIRPFADPGARGTEISRRRTLRTHPVKALSAVSGQALVTVTGDGMLGVPGIAARTFAAVQQQGISVSLISQASSEHSICFSVPEAGAERARASLESAFRDEIGRREIDHIEIERGVATFAVVGLGMAGTPGIASKTFTALAEGKINVIAIAQGSSELNLSVVVSSKEVVHAQRLVHSAFQLDKLGGGAVEHAPRTDVVLLGFGQIGRVLAGMIAKLRRGTPQLKVVGILDRSGFVFDPDGLSPRQLTALAASKGKGVPVVRAAGAHRGTAVEAVDFVARHALSNPVLVDITADDTSAILKHALASGMHLVLANKRPLTAHRKLYDELTTLAAEHARRLLHETTVGAGLPIIDTYYKLVESGDKVFKIEGCPSGTLGYVFGELGRGRRFSEALRKAIAKGYPEPDPREDLSGTDVGRKALILGRLLGFPGELADIDIESLVPEPARRLSRDEFLAHLEDYDELWERRVRDARKRGGVLRYRCTVTPRRIRVGLVVVNATSSLASLNGTDNQFIFTTRRYRANPLVITGPGAGPAVTAGGILNDILKLAAT